jgi:Mn2+ and Fe2+ transporters of the NRAMP family
VVFGLWVLCEIAICACDLAEVIGTAIALNLLFGMPMMLGVCVTALDVFVILLLQRHGFRQLEAFVITCRAGRGGLPLRDRHRPPVIADVMAGFVPQARIITDPAMLYIAIGILGATVMPHNLYLHSSIVQTRRYPRTPKGRREALRFAVADSNFALATAFFINAAILIIAAATFHQQGGPMWRRSRMPIICWARCWACPIAGVVFALALLAAARIPRSPPPWPARW